MNENNLIAIYTKNTQNILILQINYTFHTYYAIDIVKIIMYFSDTAQLFIDLNYLLYLYDTNKDGGPYVQQNIYNYFTHIIFWKRSIITRRI